MKTSAASFRRAFTLVELLVAMAVFLMLVVFLANLFSHATSVYQRVSRQHDAERLNSSLLDAITRDFQALTWGGPVGLDAQERLVFPAYGRAGGETTREWGLVRYTLVDSPDGYPSLQRESNTHPWGGRLGTSGENVRQEWFAGVLGWGFQPVTNATSSNPLGYVVTLACMPVSRLQRYDPAEREKLKLPSRFTPVASTNMTALSAAWQEHALTNSGDPSITSAYFVSRRYLPLPPLSSPRIKEPSILGLTPLD